MRRQETTQHHLLLVVKTNEETRDYTAPCPFMFETSLSLLYGIAHELKYSLGGTLPEINEIVTHICSSHNFFCLSSVQILFIPACCLLCVL